MSIAKLMMKGIARKTAVPVTTSHVYVAGLPTGSCEGGKKVTMNENSTARLHLSNPQYMQFPDVVNY